MSKFPRQLRVRPCVTIPFGDHPPKFIQQLKVKQGSALPGTDPLDKRLLCRHLYGGSGCQHGRNVLLDGPEAGKCVAYCGAKFK